MNPSVRSLYFSPLVESSRSRKGEIRQNVSYFAEKPTSRKLKILRKERKGTVKNYLYREVTEITKESTSVAQRHNVESTRTADTAKEQEEALSEELEHRLEVVSLESDGSLEDRPLIIDAEWGRIANSPVSQDEKEEETVRSEELPKEPTIVQKEKRQEYSIPVAFPQRSISHPVESGDDYDTESDTEALNPQRRAQSCNQVSEVADDRSEIESNERLFALLSDFDLHEVEYWRMD
nr:hypothetical transcript [Hymenolepis microstoma]